MSLTSIKEWFKGKYQWIIGNWVIILVVFFVLLILTWFFLKLWRDITRGE